MLDHLKTELIETKRLVDTKIKLSTYEIIWEKIDSFKTKTTSVHTINKMLP